MIEQVYAAKGKSDPTPSAQLWMTEDVAVLRVKQASNILP
jgi:hypothetical protein